MILIEIGEASIYITHTTSEPPYRPIAISTTYFNVGTTPISDPPADWTVQDAAARCARLSALAHGGALPEGAHQVVQRHQL